MPSSRNMLRRYREMNSYEKEEFRLKYRHWQSQRR